MRKKKHRYLTDSEDHVGAEHEDEFGYSGAQEDELEIA